MIVLLLVGRNRPAVVKLLPRRTRHGPSGAVAPNGGQLLSTLFALARVCRRASGPRT